MSNYAIRQTSANGSGGQVLHPLLLEFWYGISRNRVVDIQGGMVPMCGQLVYVASVIADFFEEEA